MSLQIRQANPFDLPALITLYTVLAPQEQAMPPDKAASIFGKIQSYPNYKIFLALRDNSIVGTYSLLIMDNMAHKGVPSAIVENVVVHPKFQSQGIGRSMMRHAMTEARACGCYKLVLSSNKVRVDAHRFYEKLGFKQHGISFQVDLDHHKNS